MTTRRATCIDHFRQIVQFDAADAEDRDADGVVHFPNFVQADRANNRASSAWRKSGRSQCNPPLREKREPPGPRCGSIFRPRSLGPDNLSRLPRSTDHPDRDALPPA